jgi:hypothetical protein
VGFRAGVKDLLCWHVLLNELRCKRGVKVKNKKGCHLSSLATSPLSCSLNREPTVWCATPRLTSGTAGPPVESLHASGSRAAASEASRASPRGPLAPVATTTARSAPSASRFLSKNPSQE